MVHSYQTPQEALHKIRFDCSPHDAHLEPFVTNLVESIWMSVFVCSGELIEYFLVVYSGMSLYAVILLVHCIFLYICVYAVVDSNL